MSKELDYRVDNGLAIITLRRPEAFNALTYAMIGEFRQFCDQAEKDTEVFAVAITGEGRAFCAGIDMSVLEASAKTPQAESTASADPDESPALFGHLLRLPKPVIAAINGVAAGGGFVLAMMADMRFASEAGSFTSVFSSRALVAEHGTSWLLPRLLGTSRALDILWSPRRISAAEALQLGLVNRVVPAGTELQAVADYVQEMRAKTAPRAIAEIKAQVYRQLDTDFTTAAKDCARLMKIFLAHPDALEGARSFIEKRPPRFQPWTRDL